MPPRLPRVAGPVAFALAYFACAELGHWLSVGPTPVATFWPPSGLYLAVLLRTPARRWPLFVAAALAGNAVSDTQFHGHGGWVALGFWASNTLEALTAAGLVRAVAGGRFSAGRLRHVFALAAAAVAAPAVGAGVGAGVLAKAYGLSYAAVWPVWWAGGAVGILVVGPAVAAFRWPGRAAWERAARSGRAAEYAGMFAAAAVVFLAVFSTTRPVPSAYLILPVVLWPALRFGAGGVAGVNLLLGVVAARATVTGRGPFGTAEAAAWEQVVLLQAFISFVAFTALAFAAVRRDRDRAARALRAANAALEARVRDRTAELERTAAELRGSERRYRALVQSAPCFVWSAPAGGGAAGWWTELTGQTAAESAGLGWLDAVHPDDRGRTRVTWSRAIEARQVYDIEYRVRTRSGGYRHFATHGVPLCDPSGKVEEWFGTLTDIDDRKRAEEDLRALNATLEERVEDRTRALQATEQRFQAIFHSQFQFVGLMSPDGVLLEANRTALAAAGVPAADVLGKPFWETTWWTHDPAQQDRLKAAVRKAAGGERDRFEASHPLAAGGLVWVDFSLTPFRDEAGAVVLLIPEGRDISDRVRAEVELVANETLLRQFVTHAPAAIAMLDTDMRYVQVSKRWLTDYHLNGQDVIGRSHYEVFPDIPDRWKAIHRRVLAGAVEACDEDPFPRADGGTDWLQWEARPWRKAGGQVGGLIFFTQVITARKQAEAELQHKTQVLETVLDGMGDAVLVADKDGAVLLRNRAFSRLHGGQSDPTDTDQMARAYGVYRPGGRELCPTDQLPIVRAIRGEPTDDVELEVVSDRHPEGVPISVTGRPLSGPDGVAGGVIVIRDISARRRAEAALREGAAFNRSVLDSLPAHVAVLDRHGVITAVNLAWERFGAENPDSTGVSARAGVGVSYLGVCDDSAAAGCPDAAEAAEAIRRVLAGGDAWDGLEYDCHVPAERRWFSMSVNPLATAGGGAVVSHTNITLRMIAEEAVREKEKLFRSAFEHAPIGIALVAPDGRWLDVNRALCEILGHSEAELLATDFQAITHPDDLAADLELVRQVLAGTLPMYQMEKRYFHKAGHVVHVLLSASLVRDAAGAPLYFISQVKDITERKRAEEDLRASEELLASFFEAPGSLRGVVQLVAGDIIHLRDNAESAAFFGRTPGEMRGRRATDLGVPAEAIRLWTRQYRDSSRHGGPVQFEFPVPGAGRWLQVSVCPLPHQPGERFAYVAWDVTDRKRAEEARFRSEALFRLVWESSADGMRLTDAGGTVVNANPAYCRLVGLPREQVVGRPTADAYAPATRAAVTAKHQDRFAARTVRPWQEAEVELWDGRRRWFEVAHSFVDLPGEPPALLGVFRDATERRSAEDRILASLREKEVLLKEIHHRVKNNLQIVSTLLDLQSDYTADPAAHTLFQESRGRVRSMALIHERLYRSRDMARVDFTEYVAQLADDLYRAYKVSDDDIRLDLEVDAPPLPIDLAIPCGLLLNELMSNCFKHAFRGAETGRLRVALTRDAGDGVLVVADDGPGFPPGVDFRNTASFGLQLVNTLVDQLHGAVELATRPGTAFTVRFPIPSA